MFALIGVFILLAILMAFVEYENFTGATGFVTLVLLGAIGVLYKKGLLGVTWLWITAHPFYVVGCILLYFVLACAWGFEKWYFYCLNLRDEYLEALSDWKSHHNIKDRAITEAELNTFMNTLSLPRRNLYKFPLKASEHKSQIIGWMSYWPASVVWSLINDPVKWACRNIYRKCAATYQAISNRVFSGIEGQQ